MISCDDFGVDDYDRFRSNYKLYSLIYSIIFFIEWAIGIITIYIVYRHYRKPTFVTIMWILVTLVLPVSIVRYFAEQDSLIEKLCYNMASALNTVVHWIFSVEYYELAIKFDMIFGHVKTDIAQ